VTTGADVEDIHLGYRMRRAGFRIVLDPSLQIAHQKRYTVRSVVASDFFHRAIPWTRAMFELRTFRADLNMRRSALGAAFLANLAVLSVIASVAVGPQLLLVAAAALGAWRWSARDFLGFVRRTAGIRRELSSTALLFAYFLYGPEGILVGAASCLVRRQRPFEGLSSLTPPEPVQEDRPRPLV